MTIRDLKVGSRFGHPRHGAGTVTFIGSEYLGVAFDDHGDVLLRIATLAEAGSAPVGPLPAKPAAQRAQPWPDSTFVAEPSDAEHSMGSHWRPFVDDAADILRRLPEIVPRALVPACATASAAHPRPTPGDWPRGAELVWPWLERGLAVILRFEEEANRVVTLFPFFRGCGRHRLRLHQVRVWASALEAQITAGWGDGMVTFFDNGFVTGRAWYEAGRAYDFALAGVAYEAGPAERRELAVERHPDEVAWLNRRLEPGEAPHEASVTIVLDGMAMFLPVDEWDVDDYQFRAPVKSVVPFERWLGQDGWRVSATVMRFGEQDADLDILITRRAWTGTEPPQVGQDIEGRLWLQGRLTSPGPIDEPHD